MANDIPTYDAAFGVGFASFSSSLTDTDPASYQTLTDDATAFATQVDAALLAAGGAGNNSNRANLMQAICLATIGGRSLLSLGAAGAVPSTYANLAAAIAAAFINAKAGLL